MSSSKFSTPEGSLSEIYRPSPTLMSKLAAVAATEFPRRFFVTVATKAPSSIGSTGEPFFELG